jgi:DNA-binding NarL/FixJ family response regulator
MFNAGRASDAAASPPELVGERVVILSPREKLLLRRFACGKSDKVISQEIGATQEQIGMQRKRLIEKLRVTLAGQLAARPPRPGSGKYGGNGRR